MERLLKYYVEAYVDPFLPQVRHAFHTAKRIEQRSRWNLRPNIVMAACTYQAVEDNVLTSAYRYCAIGAIGF